MHSVFSLVFASYQYVIKVDKNEIKFAANCVHQTLKGLCCVFNPNGMRRNSYRPKGVMGAVF